jgi:DNA-directed RNA polymerase specialized sigma subunit
LYINHNDYELIYLIKDGNELAYKYLFKKYKVFINKIVCDNVAPTDKRNDVIQECLMVLDSCIWNFNDDMNVSFYSYVYISVRRKINRLLSGQYLKRNIFLNENNPANIYYNIIGYARDFLEDNMEKNYYDECIIGAMSTNMFTKKYNMTYYDALKLRRSILDKIKKHIE